MLTGGGFAVAALLTFHASLPLLWTDPVGRFAEMVQGSNSFPSQYVNLFRGEWLPAADGPPFDYVPVWIGITTTPALLPLILAGAGGLMWHGLRRPGHPYSDRLRCGILAFVLPVATVVAAVVLGNSLYHGWRHLYFLHAPLLLLAIFGLRQLVSAPGGRWVRAGAYALTGTAIVVTVVSMIRIHPHQNNYFNFLVDRTTPQRLNSLYTVNYWRMSGQDLVNDIVRDSPSGDLHLSLAELQRFRQILPPHDRERIVETRDFRSGERNFLKPGLAICFDPLAPVSHVERIYATTLHCVIDPVPWFERFRREALASGEPLIRSVYDVHRDGNTLTWLRDGCPLEDIGRGFFLHVVPRHARDLPPDRVEHGFNARSFSVGARIDGNCIASPVHLPDYPVVAIRTGQFDAGGVLWEATIVFGEEYAAARREALAGGEPLARSVYDIHLAGRTLTYVRDGCTDAEADARFFLHVFPAHEDDLPEHRREHGFDNLDFTLETHGARIDGSCVAVARLPAYAIATMRTGQYDGTGALWEAEFAFREDYAAARREALAGGEPLARSVYDIHFAERTLTYVRDGCTKAEADARFFLHVFPADEADLPEHRREYGFDNLDFTLETHGARIDGNCVALARLPAYPIAAIRTGQYDGTGALWAAEFALPGGE